MDVPPTIAKPIRVVATHLETLGSGVLQDRDRIVPTFEQKFDRFRAELRRVEAIENTRPPPSRSRPPLLGKTRCGSRFAPSIKLKITIPDDVYQLMTQRFRRPA